MAGGKGSRLRPLTENTPKVMLPVGDRPILENLIRLLVSHRFHEIFVSINYLGRQITDHFGDGSALGCHITYLREPRTLGTAGALSLLPTRPADPVLVLNGDLATDLNFSALMDYHAEAECLGTTCVSEYVHEVPFGVVRCEDDQVVEMQEKPSYRQLINAGIYVLSPSLLDLVPADREFTMPDLLAEARRNGYPVAAFPIRERWSDIGQHSDYQRARDEWTDKISEWS
jgi:NDP-sugar pyrophosphorylase family protein